MRRDTFEGIASRRWRRWAACRCRRALAVAMKMMLPANPGGG